MYMYSVCVDCSHILDTPVTEREFLEQLHELNHKINFVKEQSFKDARSCHDVKDILEKLKIKASFQSYYFNLVYKWLLSHTCVYIYRHPMSLLIIWKHEWQIFPLFVSYILRTGLTKSLLCNIRIPADFWIVYSVPMLKNNMIQYL